jgi:cytochrome b pre-mRNA-processing protein 3
MLERFFRPRPSVEAGRALFAALSAQARRPAFYSDLGVADSVEGRFELYVLHLVLVLHRLKGQGAQAAETSQATFDAFLRNLDEGLRDMGVGDLSVGKKMRRLGEAVYGRMKGYDRILAEPEPAQALEDMIGRTLLEGRIGPEGQARRLAVYVLATVSALGGQPLDDILQARLLWPEIARG